VRVPQQQVQRCGALGRQALLLLQLVPLLTSPSPLLTPAQIPRRCPACALTAAGRCCGQVTWQPAAAGCCSQLLLLHAMTDWLSTTCRHAQRHAAHPPVPAPAAVSPAGDAGLNVHLDTCADARMSGMCSSLVASSSAQQLLGQRCSFCSTWSAWKHVWPTHIKQRNPPA
jgi:hypothetical protein